ncbi:glucose 1-dehydrogenase [Methanoculleus sp. FWC-SCC1]|uniref:Glucose 1-dehydrogenase n=1 Tax=Methanoculleus frigidifontis TaxID=2584085 RepID=A0ABT8MB74_9EURY|nr:glucose 1-dehydrogenase [Methanoculleus sp. FWC-SCC1]MDN7025180.1 glucose 1-dehydrogenase [Methanoculleus sp. FWC-SCC1]
MKRLDGRYALVTGGSTGIGRAIAIRFAQEGANVAINYHSSGEEAELTREEVETACSTIREYGCEEMVVQANVAREDDVQAMFARVLDAWGRIDILVNNAGIQKAAPTEDMSVSDYDKVLAVNLRGSFLCAREAIRHFLARGQGGVIINDSSVHQIIPKPTFTPYAVSKAGMGNLTRTLALEYAGRGIRVNAVGPGAIATPMNKAWVEDPEKKAEVESHIPIGRAGTPEEIAAVFAFLASDDASYITGQTVYACGGLTLYPDFRTAWSSPD